MTTFDTAIAAYREHTDVCRQVKIDIMTSHYEMKLDIWYLISEQKLVATFCNRKLELI